jgi:hypothetical protein
VYLMRPVPPLQSAAKQAQKNRACLEAKGDQQLPDAPQYQAGAVLPIVQQTDLRELQDQRGPQFWRNVDA